MSFYSELAVTALGVITEFGQSMTLRHYPAVPADGHTQRHDTSDGSVGVGVPDDYPVQGVVEQATMGRITAFGDKLGKLGSDLDRIRFVTVAASELAIVPQPRDQIYFDDAWWTIKGNSTVAPGGTIVIHQLGVVR